MIELIGEEIYDEFDPHEQGAQLNSFIPPDFDPGDKVAAMDANDPESNHLDIPLPATGPGAHSTVGHKHGLTIVKPIARRAMEGLGFITARSSSAPPYQRTPAKKQLPSKSGAPLKRGDNDKSNILPDDGFNEKLDVPHLDLPISGAYPQQPRSQPQTPLLDSPMPRTLLLNSRPLGREMGRGVVSGAGTTPRITTPVSVKGKGFKSSPLPTEMDIADGVKNKGNGSRDGDESTLPSETVMQGSSD